jgi:hypothetical protein
MENFILRAIWASLSAAVDDTYAKFRDFLEREGLIEWPFDFWEPEDKVWLLSKFERFNNVGGEILVIPAIEPFACPTPK